MNKLNIVLTAVFLTFRFPFKANIVLTAIVLKKLTAQQDPFPLEASFNARSVQLGLNALIRQPTHRYVSSRGKLLE